MYLYRLRRYSTIARIAGGCGLLFFKKQQSLYIATASIGWNLIIQHGFSTVIAAKSIGYNCWINQQVTIGYSFEENPPTIGNGCIVCAGAKVIGDVKLGDNAIVGANAVVTHDVLENEVVGAEEENVEVRAKVGAVFQELEQKIVRRLSDPELETMCKIIKSFTDQIK